MHNIDLSHLQNLQHNAKKRETPKAEGQGTAASSSGQQLSYLGSVTLPGSEEPIMDEEGQTKCRTELCSGDNLSQFVNKNKYLS